MMVRLNNLLCLTFAVVPLFVPDAYSQVLPPACFQTCLQTAAPSSGCSSTDANCVCASDTIVNSVAACIVQTCSLADLQTAQAYFNDLCSGATSSTSASASVESTTAPTSVSPTPSASPTPVSHAKRSRTAPSSTCIGFVLALALVSLWLAPEHAV